MDGGSMELTVKNLKKIGVKAGWLDGIENSIFTNNENQYNKSIINCIEECTSPKANENEPFAKENLKLIFNAFSLFEPEETKVLIIGQDPYPESGKACGLAFLHNIEGHPEIDDTLKNIFNEMKNFENKSNVEYNNSPIEWAKQNKVLLLNASLTYDGDKATLKERIGVWSAFINKIIEKVVNSVKEKPLVIILWGGCANLIEPFRNNNEDENNKNILFLRSSHPSNQGKNYCGFYDSVAKNIFGIKQTPLKRIIPAFVCEGKNHFKRCNDFLKENQIDWKGLVDIYNYKG